MSRSSQSTPLATDDDSADRGHLRFPIAEIPSHNITLQTSVIPEEAVVRLKNHTAKVIILGYSQGSRTWLDLYKSIQKAGIRDPTTLQKINVEETAMESK